MSMKLFEPGRIGNLELKNRIVMTAMGTSFAGSDGKATPEMIKFYEERAKGGCGLIITEICRIDDETGVGTPCQLAATDLSVIPSFVRLAEAIHAHDSKIFVQLHHPGNQTMSRLIGGRQIVAPSEVMSLAIGEKPRALSTEEVEELVKKFVTGAYICKTAGIDGVELHAAHGYLINQFLSPHSNKRTDKYGGDLMGRMRFLIEIIKGIQAVCGPNYPISVRIDGNEFLPDGITKEEGIEMAKILESLGVAALNVSSGTYETGYTIIEPNNFKEGWKKDLAKDIKAQVNIPVIAVNTIKHPAAAEQMLEEDVCDFVGVARGQLADPEWGNKAKAGKDKEIRKCISCLECFRILNECRPVECTLNPVLGRELNWGEDVMKKDGRGETIAVIGGGPAGMQAAIILKKRGFNPVILEKSDKLGGTMNIAALPPNKEWLGEFIETMIAEVEDLGIEVRLNTPSTADTCKDLGAKAVFVACGGHPIIPNLPGADKAYTAENVLQNNPSFEDKDLLIIGGGVTGLETADALAKNNRVTVVEMMDEVGTTLSTSANKLLLKAIMDQGGKIRTGQMLKEIKDGSALIQDRKTGEMAELPADAVILAMGVRSDRTLEKELRDAFDQVVFIGDAEKPGMIKNALHAAYDKAFVFESAA